MMMGACAMGAYQSLAVAALDADVTEVKAGIPWCADFAGPAKFGRLGGMRLYCLGKVDDWLKQEKVPVRTPAEWSDIV